MLQAFIDDSASESQSDKRLYLAGYLTTTTTWSSFADEWSAVLSTTPVVHYLHMSKRMRGVDETQQKKKIEALANVIKKHQLISFDCSISRSDYKSIVIPNAPYDLRHAYFPCFIGIMHCLAKLLHAEGLEGPVELTFDQQGNVGENAALWYLPVKHSYPELTKVLGKSPNFEDDTIAIPLQAADMLAWHLRRSTEPNFLAQHRVIMDLLIHRHYSISIPKEMLERWSKEFSGFPGIESTKGPKGSVRGTMRKIINQVPPEQLIAKLKSVDRRARRIGLLKALGTRFQPLRILKRLMGSEK